MSEIYDFTLIITQIYNFEERETLNYYIKSHFLDLDNSHSLVVNMSGLHGGVRAEFPALPKQQYTFINVY